MIKSKMRKSDARKLAFAAGSQNQIVVNPTPPTKAEIETWAAENGVAVRILTSPKGKVEGVQTDGDVDNAKLMAWFLSRM